MTAPAAARRDSETIHTRHPPFSPKTEYSIPISIILSFIFTSPASIFLHISPSVVGPTSPHLSPPPTHPPTHIPWDRRPCGALGSSAGMRPRAPSAYSSARGVAAGRRSSGSTDGAAYAPWPALPLPHGRQAEQGGRREARRAEPWCGPRARRDRGNDLPRARAMEVLSPSSWGPQARLRFHVRRRGERAEVSLVERRPGLFRARFGRSWPRRCCCSSRGGHRSSSLPNLPLFLCGGPFQHQG
jgi:hypothetical protein